MKKTLAGLVACLAFSSVCFAASEDIVKKDRAMETVWSTTDWSSGYEPVTYGDDSGFLDTAPPPVKSEEQKEEEKEDIDSMEMEQEKAEEGLPYSKTTVTEKVPIYRNGKIVGHKSLRKKVYAVRQTRDGKKGWYTKIAEEYVKYWHTTEHKKEPVIKIRTTERFYPDGADGKPTVDPKEL